ncbi:5-hydroxytryptamine receptor 1D-like [Strongylocentrotus purpuratus]|uniref:G-protein coupled receptors family 1 profile domain-containing protein n=1 Tax=Strongylocentrotus purpuratus TaxID=7668 RepID=A0A7M7RBM8_STRPU|nr:5-hydroxytryptamine receptor 1D-like [Strongylocentrotus purpuratus]
MPKQLKGIPNVVHTHLGYYPFSHRICRVVSAIQAGLLNASNFAIVVICVDRHRATYDPINHFMSRSKRMAIIKNSIPWIVSLAFWFLYTTAPEFIIGFDNGRYCARWYRYKPLLTVMTFISYFYLPFTIISVLYFRIVLKIRASFGGREVVRQFAMQEPNGESTLAELHRHGIASSGSTLTINTDLSSANHDGDLKMKDSDDTNMKKTTTRRESSAEMHKATKTLLFIVVAFVVSWLPQSIIILIYSIEPVLIIPELPRPVLLFFGWMLFLNSLLNPIS